MLVDYFNEKQIGLDAPANTPEEAIAVAGKLLVDSKKAKEEYIDSMIDTFHNLGPYMVIAPGIAIPHGKPGDLVNEDCICFCRLKNPVKFGNENNDPVRYMFAIGAHESGGHLDMLRELSLFLMQEGNIDRLSEINTKEEFLDLLKKGGACIERS